MVLYNNRIIREENWYSGKKAYLSRFTTSERVVKAGLKPRSFVLHPTAVPEDMGKTILYDKFPSQQPVADFIDLVSGSGNDLDWP